MMVLGQAVSAPVSRPVLTACVPRHLKIAYPSPGERLEPRGSPAKAGSRKDRVIMHSQMGLEKD